MNRSTSLLLGYGALSSLFPAFAAPTGTTASNAASRALLGKSAAAYSALNSYSATLYLKRTSTMGQKAERTQLKGTFAFKRPNKSLLSLKNDSSFYRSVQDGKNIYTQQDAKTYQVAESPREVGIVGALIGQKYLSLMMAADLINGNAHFADQKGASMRLATVKGLPQISVTYPPSLGIGATMLLEFDPRSKLLRSFEMRVKGPDYSFQEGVLFSQVKINPKLDAKLFSSVPSPGAKRVDAPPMFDPTLKVGGKPHEISGPDFGGKAISLSNYRGRVVLIDLWATWCGPCVAEIPHILAAYNKYHSQGFDVLSISSDDNKEVVQKFVAARKLPWTQLWDKDCVTSPLRQYKVAGIPFLLLVGKDGMIAAINPRGEELAPAVEAALAK